MSALPEAQTVDAVPAAYQTLLEGYRAEPYPDLQTRQHWLKELLDAVIHRREAIARAISADWGHRSWHESMIADVWVVAEEIRYLLKHLKSWMRPERRGMPYYFLPATGRVWRLPKGVVGVVAPWNYPFQLAVMPAAGALAAGNRVLIKPSEQCPRTSALIEEVVRRAVGPEVCQVVHGGPEVSAAVCALPLDHLFFTGSPRVGRLVMKAAAENLTPVTLELGGKCPMIVTPGFDLDRAATSLALGKLFNAGQTCIAVDTLLVQERDREPLLERFRAQVAQMFPTLRENPDYSAISSPKHLARLRALVEEAREGGATVLELNPDGEDLADSGKMVPTVVIDPPADSAIATEEIFGPVLSVVSYTDLGEARRWLEAHPDPLALYWMDDDPDRTHAVVLKARSGGMLVNDVLFHFAAHELPFGGIRNSGIGQAHGRHSFDTFTHPKAVAYQARLNGISLFNPPYGSFVDRALSFLIGTS